MRHSQLPIGIRSKQSIANVPKCYFQYARVTDIAISCAIYWRLIVYAVEVVKDHATTCGVHEVSSEEGIERFPDQISPPSRVDVVEHSLYQSSREIPRDECEKQFTNVVAIISHQCGSHRCGSHQCGSHQCGSHQCGSHRCGSHRCGSHQCLKTGHIGRIVQRSCGEPKHDQVVRSVHLRLYCMLLTVL